MQKRYWPLAIPLVYLALSVLMTWPLAARLGADLPSSSDTLQQTWILAWNAHALLSDPAHLWQAPIFYPYPDTAAYHDHLLIQSIIGAPLIWATGNPLLAHNVLLLLSFALTGWGGFLLSRDLIAGGGAQGADADARRPAPSPQTWAALIVGAAMTFSAYRIAHSVQLNMLQTGWMLFAMLFLRRLLLPTERGGGRWRDALLCGVFTGLQVANAFYYGFFVAILIVGYVGLWAAAALWGRLRRAEPLPWAVIPRLMLAGLVSALIAVPFLLPYIGIYRTLGIIRSPLEIDNWSAPLRAYVSVTSGNLLYGRLGGAVIDSGEMVLFPGLLIALLGLISLGLWPRRGGAETIGAAIRDHVFWAMVALASFVLSLGSHLRLIRFSDPLPVPLPYLTLYQLLPGFGSMRVPARWGWLVTVALALLAALPIARLLAHLRGRWRHGLGAALLSAVLIEQIALPLPLSRSVLANVPPIYPWLGAAAQADIRTVIELPTGPIPRGDNLARITWRHFLSIYHWKRLPVAYGALIPFGAIDLMRYLDRLPSPAGLRVLQFVGVDTIIVHGDAYAPDELGKLRDAMAASPELSLRAQVGDSLVYTLRPDPRLALPPGSVTISNDERMPGVAVLGLIRRWQDEGRQLYGPGRLRYYAPLATAAVGQVADYALLSDAEDPSDYGYSPSARLWEDIGLALYQRSAGTLASLSLAEPVPGQFHPRFPASLELALRGGRLLAGGRELDLGRAADALTVEIDCARLRPGALLVGGVSIAVPAGLSTLRVPLRPDGAASVAGEDDKTALLRLRVLAGTPGDVAVDPHPGAVASADVSISGDELVLRAAAAGAPGLLVDVWGAATSDDRPIHLLSGVAPLSADGALDTRVSLLSPDAGWVSQWAEPQDGRYIVYLKDPARPEGPGQPVAKFFIRGGRVAEPEGVPLPLTAVP
ncbi:hypothetical protein K2Z83_12280 [Oscillochloris sp. ZM17-4]|uniref:hypothetical protein n=1 Tax=Oscillochloris sp. ZM17-4 TaxID=2866714 RepID=UPI001C737EF7|nr:hypothetical protein [Oscillochloris sp. ZM17-4]MBX0328454.1 hypothetical protein [Oscillochloris sp. ZM17-4]